MISVKRLSDLLQKYFDIEDVDEYALEYISDLIENHKLSETSLEDIDYFLKETFEKCADLPEKQRISNLEKLLFEVNVVDKLTTSLRKVTTAKGNDPTDDQLEIDCSNSKTIKEALEKRNNPALYLHNARVDSKVQQLLELCQSKVCFAYLKHVLIIDFDGDVEKTADWLLGTSNLVNLEHRWKKEEQMLQEAEASMEASQQKLKKSILEKFDLEKPPEECALRKAGDKKPASLLSWNNSENASSRVRYRDGEAVAFKGEKFILKSDRPEWDGGSRGKVYTKGKRGKGFH